MINLRHRTIVIPVIHYALNLDHEIECLKEINPGTLKHSVADQILVSDQMVMEVIQKMGLLVD